MASTEITLFDNSSHREPVIALWKSVFGYDAPHNRPALSIDRKVAVDDRLFFVATDSAAVIGTIMAGYDGHRGWIYSLAVHPDHRMRGIGTQLVLHAEQILVERGCVKINLQVMPDNKSVVEFYSSLGYRVEPRISMGKRIVSNDPRCEPM